MARTVKPEEYSSKRAEILEAASRLIYTKGFEEMSIQDILDALQISKGAFYHYFTSKMDLLEAVIDRLANESEKVIMPILEDPDLDACQKLRRYFDDVNRWKVMRKDFFMSLMRMWYADENALVRQKLTVSQLERLSGHFKRLIREGVAEGVMQVRYPDRTGEVLLVLVMGMGEDIGLKLLKMPENSPEMQRECLFQEMVASVEAYTEAIARVLGIQDPDFQLMDPEPLRTWI